jgi:hypothetical protein
MKRILVCALALAGLACGSTNNTSDGAGAAAGGTSATATGGTSGTSTETGAVSGSGGNTNTGASGTTSTGGDAASGGTRSTATGGTPGSSTAGTTGTGAGGTAGAATGGTTNPGTGGRASTGTGGRAGTGTGGGTSTGTGGGTSTGTGGGTSTGTGGGTSEGGVTTVATGPTAKDPTTAAEGLPQYYISNNGDDANSGSSPEEAWATFTNIPRNQAVAVFFDKGSSWTVTVGGTVRSGLSVSAGSVYATYGTGDRPLIELASSDGKTAMGAVQLGGNNLVDGLKVKGYAVIGFPIGTDGNVVQNCEVDGSIEGEQYGKMQLGFSISGQHNLVVGNYVHDLSGLSGDTGNVNTSGGSEAFVMNAGNNEVAYNTAINCWVPNETLNGAEGGCLEIIGNKAGELIENAFFHHNYCERSVGLFEACAGNFSGDGQKIQLNHAIVRHSMVSYNVSVDAMWLYLLQPVNTDFDGLVFEHNTLIHGPDNTIIPQGGASAFGIAYDTDPVWTTGTNPTYISCTADTDCGEQEHCLDKQGAGKICQYQWKVQPGNITVRNNLFVVLPGADAAMMVPPPGPDDFVNNIFVPKAPMGVQAGTGAIVVSDAGLVDTFHLAPTSPAVDTGSPDAMQPWVDWEGNQVPCGNAPDVGAVEYCP